MSDKENNLAVLPVWKRDATLADRLDEMASYARAKPERFTKFVMCYVELLPNGNLKPRILLHGCDLPQALGLFELGKAQAYEDSKT
jgi:hypothetical protein